MEEHRIGRLVFDLTAADESLLAGFGHTVRTRFDSDLLPALEAALDGMDCGGATIRLDRVDVEMGTLHGDDLGVENLARRMAEGLAARLRALPRRESESGPGERDDVDELVEFLKSGELPWSAPGRALAALGRALLALDAPGMARVAVRLRPLLIRRDVAERLVRQLPAAFVYRLLRQFLPPSQAVPLHVALGPDRPGAGIAATHLQEPQVADVARLLVRLAQGRDEPSSWERSSLFAALDPLIPEWRGVAGQAIPTRAIPPDPWPRSGTLPMARDESWSVETGMVQVSAGLPSDGGDGPPRTDVEAVQETASPTGVDPLHGRVMPPSGPEEALLRQKAMMTGEPAHREVAALSPPIRGASQRSEEVRRETATGVPGRVETQGEGGDMPRIPGTTPAGYGEPGRAEVTLPAWFPPVGRGRESGSEVADDDPSAASAVHRIHAAGAVLLYPFLSGFFGKVHLLDGEGRFPDQGACARAVVMAHQLATGAEETPEPETTLFKLMCGLPFAFPVARRVPWTAEARAEAESLLASVIGHWKQLGNTSADGLREGFLLRSGRLSRQGETWRLSVETRSIDVLLDHLPWTLSRVKTPFMRSLLTVDWR